MREASVVPTTGDDGWEEGDDDDVEVGDERIENGNGETADITIAFPNPFTLFESVPIRTSFLALLFISSLGDVSVYVNEYRGLPKLGYRQLP